MTILSVKNLKKYFHINKKVLKAVDDISFDIKKGETLALVGESASGKSTAAKTILRLIKETSGKVFFEGEDIFSIPIKNFKEYRKKMQIIFQDPYASLDPRMMVKQIIEEPIKVHKIKDADSTPKLLELVKMPAESIKKFPHEFSGGQRQRIGIARALALKPKFLILDEPVSALDVSIQAQIINLLKDLQKSLNLTYLFIAHDLAVVRYIADSVVVLYHGQMMEYGPSEKIFESPKHPYTKTLLESVRTLELGKSYTFTKSVDSNRENLGCSFCKRCSDAKDICFKKRASATKVSEGHMSSCHLL